MTLRTALPMLTAIALSLSPAFVSCKDDDPARHEGIEKPDGPRDEPGGNDRPGGEAPGGDEPGGETPGSDQEDENSVIVGEWRGDRDEIFLTFDAGKRFEGNLGDGPIIGGYDYKDFPHQLLLNIETETEIRTLELKCLISGDSMKLLDIAGHTWTLTRTNQTPV